ncbi:hypothetical protein FZCC0069_10335 [Rhodobacterales bacterium FZCC0069]|nr:hypothetical protein [Rhodobacterales bacterium FZCC0069]
MTADFKNAIQINQKFGKPLRAQNSGQPCRRRNCAEKNDGAEGAIQQTYVSSMHFGMIPVAPGYGDPVKFEDGGIPYGFVMQPGELTDTLKKSLHYQIKRQVEITFKIAS